MAAPAIGPGVGGTRQWVIVSPRERAIAVHARDMPAFLVTALLSGVRMT